MGRQHSFVKHISKPHVSSCSGSSSMHPMSSSTPVNNASRKDVLLLSTAGSPTSPAMTPSPPTSHATNPLEQSFPHRSKSRERSAPAVVGIPSSSSSLTPATAEATSFALVRKELSDRSVSEPVVQSNSLVLPFLDPTLDPPPPHPALPLPDAPLPLLDAPLLLDPLLDPLAPQSPLQPTESPTTSPVVGLVGLLLLLPQRFTIFPFVDGRPGDPTVARFSNPNELTESARRLNIWV